MGPEGYFADHFAARHTNTELVCHKQGESPLMCNWHNVSPKNHIGPASFIMGQVVRVASHVLGLR